MPELPEVEIAAVNLRRWTKGRRVSALDAEPSRITRPHSAAQLARALRGRRFAAIERHGKNLMFSFSGGAGVHSHLGMTGKWLRRREDEPAPRFSRLRLHLDDGHVLHYCDLRLFGRFRLVPGARFAALPELAALGADPLHDGIDPAVLHARLSRTRRPVKVALMDQSLLAGVGNIYASEALFRARIDPRRRASSISPGETAAIARAIVAAMRQAITRQMSPEIVYVEEPGSKNPFRVYDRAGEPCPRCRKDKLRRIVQAQRSTFFCPRCQRRA